MKLKIIKHTKPMLALCTLGSLNFGAIRHPEELRRPVRLLHRALHNLLQYQDFLSIHSKTHNEKFEPIGIGVTNVAYWHAKRKLKYGEPDALQEMKRWMEHLTFYLTEMSVDLAKEKGPCLESKNTWYGRGIFPWERRSCNVDELTDFTPSDELNWEKLRSDMLEYGVRNACTTACPPVESSSLCINSTNGFNMVKDLITIKSSKAGDFPQVVPEYKKLKHHYELLWDQPDCINFIKTIAVMQAYVDQGLSSDTFYSPKFFPEGKIPITLVAKNLMLAHRWGLTTHYYNLIEKQALIDGIPLVKNENSESSENSEISNSDDVCSACIL